MDADINEFIVKYRKLLDDDVKRLVNILSPEKKIKSCDNEHHENNKILQSNEGKENLPVDCEEPSENLPLDLGNDDALKGAEPLLNGRRINMLRCGKYSPNNPQLMVNAAPHLGVGEYEPKRSYSLRRQREDYLDHAAKVQYSSAYKPEVSPNSYVSNSFIRTRTNLSPYDGDQFSSPNALVKSIMDKPKSILSNRRMTSPRERLLSDMQHSYTPSFYDGFSYQERSEELERERMKREVYQRELGLQIEEKRRLRAMKEEQDRREQDLQNRRIEQQILRMQEEHSMEQKRRYSTEEQMRRHSEDLLRRKYELQSRLRNHTESESSVTSLRNTTVASKSYSHYSPPLSRRNPYACNVPSTSTYPDVSTRYNNPTRFDSYYHRKDTLNRMDSLNTTPVSDRSSRYNAFSRYDSLSRIDSFNRQDALSRLESLTIKDNLNYMQRRHSATQQDLSMIKRSPKLQRRSSSGRFDSALPIPILKAHSPVAKELKHSVPFNSSKSEAFRKLEDKWQVPAVQRTTVFNHANPSRDGQGRSILTQLGALRLQLQQEQFRMDETLRKREITQSKAVDFH